MTLLAQLSNQANEAAEYMLNSCQDIIIILRTSPPDEANISLSISMENMSIFLYINIYKYISKYIYNTYTYINIHIYLYK